MGGLEPPKLLLLTLLRASKGSYYDGMERISCIDGMRTRLDEVVNHPHRLHIYAESSGVDPLRSFAPPLSDLAARSLQPRDNALGIRVMHADGTLYKVPYVDSPQLNAIRHKKFRTQKVLFRAVPSEY
eukprot:SAG11_NODE_20373_length_446_cov_36.521614_1_plen_127_part_01